LRITVRGDGSVTLTVPGGVAEGVAEGFLRSKAAWVLKHAGAGLGAGTLRYPNYPTYAESKAVAQRAIMTRVRAVNRTYGFRYARVSVRNQKSRWGSCSRKGNLSFNFRVMFLPEPAQDYIVAHELCHLAEFNHSPKFWAQVARVTPDYKEVRKALKGRFRL
jgi:predicted metal-dependent hydrolase